MSRTKLALVPLILAALSASAAKADIVLSFQSVTTTAGATGTFDALLTNTGASAVNIESTDFTIDSSNADFLLQSISTNTSTAPYIFPDSLFGPQIDLLGEGTQSIEGSDIDNDIAGVNISAGETVGIGNVTFTAAGTATPGESTTLTFDAPNSNFSNSEADGAALLAFSTTPGTISIPAAPTVPEPASVLLALAGIVAFGASKLARKHRTLS